MTQAFNLSQLANNVNTSGQLNAAAGLYNQTPVANGGTGKASVTSGRLLIGAGTSVMTELTGAATNDVVTWDGTAWISQVSGGGQAPVVTIYTSPATWTKPALVKAVKVTVLSGGGGGGGVRNSGGAGGGGGGAGGFVYLPAASIPGPQPLAAGVAGTGGVMPSPGPFTTSNGTPGGTASFGTFITATGGASNSGTAGGATGSFTAPAPTGRGWVGRSGAGSAGPGVPSVSGAGGDSFQYWGFGGPSRGPNPTPISLPGNPGTGYGSGGGGGFSISLRADGGNGAPGYVIVEEFY